MLTRTATAFVFLAAVAACSEQEQQEPACCAIVPKATCEAALGALGMTKAEKDALFGPETVCPSSVIGIDRIRELDGEWPQAYREAGMMSPLLGIDSAACRSTEVSLENLEPSAGVDVQAWAACGNGLKSRGLDDNEIWAVMHNPDRACPIAGVNEVRIREIIANDWEAASCKQFTTEQMLKAMNSGACGGDAG